MARETNIAPTANMAETMRAAVLGSGAWGTTFAQIMADGGAEVRIWTRDAQIATEINTKHTNARSVPHLSLAQQISASTAAKEVLSGAHLVAIAVPSQVSRGVLESLAHYFPPQAIAISLMKGIEQHTEALMSEVVAQSLDLPDEQVVVVSGPNLALEVAAKQPTATVVASPDIEVSEEVAAALYTSYFRPFTNTDVIGVELCGAMKNVIALGCGLAQGYGFGLNTVASIITRGLVEMTRMGMALGARPETFSGLAGMGDLVATCASPLSRNTSIGLRLGRGMSLEEALIETGGTAEGVWTASAVLDLAHTMGLHAPVTAGVVASLAGRGVDDVMDMMLRAQSPTTQGLLEFDPPAYDHLAEVPKS